MVANIPAWVFAVFALLLVAGVWLSRPRTVSPIGAVALAVAFAVYSFYGVVSSFSPAALLILPWLAALLVSAVFGRRVFGPANLERVPGTARVRVPGSWVPLGLMMGIFAAKFAVGFVQGAHLPIGQHDWFAPTTCVALGALSGGFASRALTVSRFVRRATDNA